MFFVFVVIGIANIGKEYRLQNILSNYFIVFYWKLGKALILSILHGKLFFVLNA